jgi:hypothetical protein
MKTTNRLATVSFLALSTLTGASCLAELGEGEDVATGDAAKDADVTQETSPLFYAGFWIDDPSQPTPHWGDLIVGIARNHDKTYTWYRDGGVCSGTNTVLCADGWWDYSAPDNRWKGITGIAIEPRTNFVYAWHDDGTYTIGSPTVLSSIAGKRPVTMPSRIWAGVNLKFNPSDLVDVYCKEFPLYAFPSTPTCVFYWQLGLTASESTVIWRTVGTPSNPASQSGAQQVTRTRSHGDIRGIDMNYDNGKVYTWYADGRINMSTDSLNLAQ